VPIDAAVLMEAAEKRQRNAVPSILTTDTVADIAAEWAKERKLHEADEPALLLVCPLINQCVVYQT
jgi:hypothetical protein